MNYFEFPRLGEAYWEERLENGLLVRIVPKREFARSYAFLAVDYGAIDTEFKSTEGVVRTPDGVAHYLEHKMFDLPEGNAMDFFAASGGNPNAFTGYGMTAYYFDCTEQFEENLHGLLRLVTVPYFTPESVEKERGIIAQEIRMYEDSPESQVAEDLFRILFAEHPMRVPIAGSVESISQITVQTLYDCHAAFYRPENMMLCIVGDVDAARAMETIRKDVPASAGQLPQRLYGKAEKMLPVTAKTQRTMSVAMPTFAVGFKCEAPQAGKESMRREVIADLASEVLAGESSPLYMRLYEAGLIDADFSIGYESVKEASLLSAGGDSCDPEAVCEEIVKEAERIVEEGVDEELFRRLLRSSLGRRMRDLDSFESICYRMCAYYFDGADYFSFPEAYDSVKPEDVREFLRQTVRRERMALAVILPKESEDAYV